jgi:aminoacyl tRNA synthase complex-interacting multifunctional protein 1
VCNLRPSRLRGILSQAMLLCAYSEDKVELLEPPNNSQPGEFITVKGYERNFAKEINKKNRIFDLVQIDLKTNEDLIVTYKNVPLEIQDKGFIKCKSLKSASIR